MDWFSAWKPGENWWFRWWRIFLTNMVQALPTSHFCQVEVEEPRRRPSIGEPEPSPSNSPREAWDPPLIILASAWANCWWPIYFAGHIGKYWFKLFKLQVLLIHLISSDSLFVLKGQCQRNASASADLGPQRLCLHGLQMIEDHLRIILLCSRHGLSVDVSFFSGFVGLWNRTFMVSHQFLTICDLTRFLLPSDVSTFQPTGSLKTCTPNVSSTAGHRRCSLVLWLSL